jgi:hypothetical protein
MHYTIVDDFIGPNGSSLLVVTIKSTAQVIDDAEKLRAVTSSLRCLATALAGPGGWCNSTLNHGTDSRDRSLSPTAGAAGEARPGCRSSR